MNSETKLFSGIILVTIVIIIGAAFVFSRPTNTPPADPKLLMADDSYTSSTASAAITLVSFSDFQCPACGAYHAVVKQLQSKYKDSLKVVFRHFPLNIHPNAVPAAIAAEAAGKQGKFWEMHDTLYEKQAEWSDEKKATDMFINYAKELGLDEEMFKKDLTDPTIQKKINRDVQNGNALGINSTPSFYINNVKIANPASFADFDALIQSAQEKTSSSSATK